MNENKMPVPPKQTRTASQRLADVENGLSELFDVSTKFIRDLSMLKEALRLLDNKVSSIIQASTSGEAINDETVDRFMIDNNVEVLKQKVKNFVEQGYLVPEEAVGDNSFVVIKELDADGIVISPRVQFARSSLVSEEIKTKLVNVKVGDSVTVGDDLTLTVLESYKIQNPQNKENLPATETQPSPSV